MIINIPLQLDEATIEGQISKDYEKKVKDIIAKRIEEVLDNVNEFLNSNRDVIVEAASKELVEKLYRTKRVKEAVANVLENGDDQ